eukprot:CAMPEP_0202957134 /NCGR_PEP_ID=MMETSP1396-20130829/1573_1 /ASSEMBLY_ACC=CAM_ASM_000872 /TAXON_ID= /ORGANISM="Pseudokeronopsis sp., Strain Brazil" /LENGTH=73 /DNA_ID=CAMNT_0049674475 /DNA_START=376 /DNA_END=597 /DNA_ORIENTATION=-
MSIALIRGKKKVGYELSVKVKFVGQGPKDKDEISFHIKDFMDYDPDYTKIIYVNKVKGERDEKKIGVLRKEIE